MLSSWLVAASATIVGLLGAAHLFHTFVGAMLRPTDAALVSAMQSGLLAITRETTVWRGWIGFNASHSLGALLFGAVFVHLPLAAPGLFFRSFYLQALGLLVLAAYVLLARRYWFQVPLIGLALALLLYLLGLALAFAGGR